MIGKYIALVYTILMIILLPVGIILGIRSDKKDFNNGICPRCGAPLRHFDTDSQGGRGYNCTGCGKYYTWISWPVDRKYIKQAEKEYYNDGLGDRNGNPFKD